MDGGRIRLLHVIQNLNYGGMEKVLADLVRGLDPRRFECHVLTLVYLGRFSREMEGVAQLHVGPRMTPASLIRPVALARTLRSLAPHIVHTHSGVWYKVARASRMAGVGPVVHTEHGRQIETRLARFLDRRAARITDRVVPVSQALRDYLVGRLCLPPTAFTVIRNGVNAREFSTRPRSNTLRSELGLAPNQFIVGSIGRLEAVKGYEVVIDAMAILRARHPERDPVLVVAGEGSCREALEQRLRRHGLERSVHLLGWRDDPVALLSAFDCFVMGSWSEGTSISLLEAMAAAVPPVVTSVGGNPDVLGPGLAEQAAPPGDAPGLADRLARLFDPMERARVGAEAQERVRAAFGVETMVEAYQHLYEDLLAGR